MRSMTLTIVIVTPAPKGSRKGNRITAVRWARLLRRLGHHVKVVEEYQGQSCDVLIALHAHKSHSAIVRSITDAPNRPLIVILTGTDLYGDIHHDAHAQQSLDLATRLVVLQRLGVEELPGHVRDKARVIYQSVSPPKVRPRVNEELFEVCVVGHLRQVKDPFRAAEAARLLPASSRIKILQIGSALDDRMAKRAKQEAGINPRFEWLGELSRPQTLQTMCRCRLLVLSSRLEGGANAVCEALACDLPILSSKIPGSIGILGEDYPGYFEYGITRELADLLYCAETDEEYYHALKTHCQSVKHLVEPERELQSWRELLQELVGSDEKAMDR